MGGFVQKIMPKPEQPRLVTDSLKTAQTETPLPEEDEPKTTAKRNGRASTILTSARGISDTSATGRKLLLGE